ncbi:OLC1v1035363C1 [Oldenlandia corymbosa var. corymbosa]|uniref:OLC1v1035363C1 n=1 Tax=Oldenlandia corymbosa var. corymbosa TaxID=529605 RepID=A0AAV1CU13_OLDCO|nr:OLC1v1035363C1 [Oldenlandia corymbosa var. corymbosa]
MLSCSTLPVMNKEALFLPSKRALFLTDPHSSSVLRSGLRRRDAAMLSPKSTKNQAVLVLANSNGSPRKGSSGKEIIMVDPLEAKRLAAKQMERIKAKERFKRQRQIEAINGAWAMIGLTAGLVIEAQTGHGILSQLAGYLAAVTGFFHG